MLGGLAAAGVFALGALAPQAHADESTAESIKIDGKVAEDGTLTVSQTITFNGAAPSQLSQRIATKEPADNSSDYRYEVSDLKASAEGGADLGASVSDDGDYKVITLDATKAGGKPITISYKVKGAVHPQAKVDGQPDTSMFRFRVLQGLSVGATEVTGTVDSPGQVTSVDCKAGPPVKPTPCQMWQGGTGEEPMPTFTDGPRGAGEVVQLAFTTEAASMAVNEQVDHHWSLDRAFSLSPLALLLSLGTLALGGLAMWALHRAAGRDQAAMSHPQMVAEFNPVGDGEEEFVVKGDVRPGQIGTVADEHVDPVDVTGTLLDLAVRGHLRIHELPRESLHAPLDWRFERREGGQGRLHAYEETLLNAVAPADAEGVTVSNISTAVGSVIPQVQDELYDDVVASGWFANRPDRARNTWARIGWTALLVALVACAALVAFTTLGLWGLALILVALGLIFLSGEMPRRTTAGSEMLAGLHVLAADLQNHRTDRMPKGREYSELSEILPYAIVLGGKDRWLEAIVAADDDAGVADPEDLDWYHAPATWQLQDLPTSVNAFVTTVQGRLFGR